MLGHVAEALATYPARDLDSYLLEATGGNLWLRVTKESDMYPSRSSAWNRPCFSCHPMPSTSSMSSYRHRGEARGQGGDPRPGGDWRSWWVRRGRNRISGSRRSTRSVRSLAMTETPESGIAVTAGSSASACIALSSLMLRIPSEPPSAPHGDLTHPRWSWPRRIPATISALSSGRSARFRGEQLGRTSVGSSGILESVVSRNIQP